MSTRTKWVIGGVVAALVAAGAVAAMQLGGDGEDAGPDAPRAVPSVLPAGILEVEQTPIETGFDDAFAVGIYAADCGFENVITPNGRLAAQGEFCAVDINVANLGDAPRGLPLDCQFLVDGAGERHTPHQEASSLDPDYPEVFGGRMTPGQVYNAVQVIYEVPNDTTPVSYEFHGACGSPGIPVQIPAPDPTPG